jgi:hypothetical protein
MGSERINTDVAGVRVTEHMGSNDSGEAEGCNIFCGNGNAYHHLRAGCFVHNGIISTVKRVRLNSNNRKSYIIQRGHCCDIQNVQAPAGSKSGDTEDIFYK